MHVHKEHRPRIFWRKGVVAVATAVALAVTAVPAAAEGEAKQSGWVVVPGLDIAGASSLNGVAAFGDTAVLAVGSQGVAGTPSERALTARWNGWKWVEVAAPTDIGLFSVSGTGSSDAWAVGSTDDASESVILRWNGSRWTAVPHVAATPDAPVGLSAVEALSPTGAWAVGFRGSLFDATGHAQRWNGTRWTETAVPQPTGVMTAILTSASGTSSNNVWATGFAIGETGYTPYFARWNGSKWSLVVPPSNISGGYTDIEMTGTNSFIAVGATLTEDSPDPVPVVASYTGGTWKQEPLPVANAELNAVTADGNGNVWVAGNLIGPEGLHDTDPLILRRTNGQWSVAATPVAEPGVLRDVQAVPNRGGVWAVGATSEEVLRHEAHEHLILGYGVD